jgi:hypothetical protein
MATNARHSIRGKLVHERDTCLARAAECDTAIRLIDDVLKTAKAATHERVLAHAITRERKTRAPKAPKPTTATQTGQPRVHFGAILAGFSEDTPTPSTTVRNALGLEGKAINTYVGRAVRLKLLKRTAKGVYLRTRRPYTPPNGTGPEQPAP